MVLKLIPTSHDFCHLLSHLLMFLDCQYGEQYGPRSDCMGAVWSGFIVFTSKDKIESEVQLNICSRLISRHHFQDKILACLELSILADKDRCSEIDSV